MSGTRFAFGLAVRDTQRSPLPRLPSELAPTRVSSAWSTHCCCARCRSTSQAAWARCPSGNSFRPTTARRNFTSGDAKAPTSPIPRCSCRTMSTLGGVRDAGRAHVAQTSWNFFSTLGTQPVLGRGFMPEEDTAGHNAIAVIGYGLWQQLFAGERRALGATIRIDGNPLTIVGVAPPGFDYPGGSVLWKPAVFSAGNNGWDTVVRLKAGIAWPQARAAFDAEVDRLSPNRGKAASANPRPRLISLRDGIPGPAKNGSLMLMASVVLVLLIACTNVANLLMARTADRAAELS